VTRRANGEGSVSERKDGRREGAAYVLLADGTYARRRVYGRTRQEASRRLTEIVSRSQGGLPADATEWTVERFLTYWLDQVVKPTRKPKTYEGYELVARVHLIPALGRKRLHRLTAADVRLFVKRVESAKPPPSTRLVQQVHAVLRNALQAAVREELIGRNVASLVQVASPSYDVNRGLTVAQARSCSPFPGTIGCTRCTCWRSTSGFVAGSCSGCSGATSTSTPDWSRSGPRCSGSAASCEP